MQADAARPGSLRALRATNRRRVLDALRTAEGLSQAGLSRATGLSAASVSGIVRDLVQEGAVTTYAGAQDGRRGRLVRLADGQRARAVGVDLGRTHVRVVLGSGVEDVVAERLVALELGHEPQVAVETVVQLVTEVCREVGTSVEELVGVGVGVARPVLDDAGTLPATSAPRGWGGLRLGEVLAEALGRAVLVENDANLGALAVAHVRRLAQPVVFVKVGSGIGAGVAVRGEVVRGRRGFAGNIGHLTMDSRLTTVCQCGRRGCLETVASLDAVRRTLGAASGTTLTVEQALDLVRGQDPVALQVLDEAGQLVGRAVGLLATVLDPELVVIGGPAAAAGAALLDAVVRGFRGAVTASVAGTAIELAPSGERTEAIGALLLALERSSVN